MLYVAKQGSRVSVKSGRVAVASRHEEPLISVPSTHVSRIACFGSVGVTSGLREWAMNNEVDVVFLSRSGKFQGQLLSAHGGSRVRRLRVQLAAADQLAVGEGHGPVHHFYEWWSA